MVALLKGKMSEILCTSFSSINLCIPLPDLRNQNKGPFPWVGFCFGSRYSIAAAIS